MTVKNIRWLDLSKAAVLILLAVTVAWATEFRFDRWSTAEGLPQNTVNSIVQTRDGYLWIATFGGLARFDGMKFTVFNTVNAPALKSSRITALHEDRAGILWVGTETGEISCLQNGEFKSFDDSEEEEIYSLYVDRHGALWAGGTAGARRYILPENACSANTHSFERIKPPLLDNQSSEQISTIVESADGDIWLNNFGVSEQKLGRLLRWRENKPLEIFSAADGLPGIISVSGKHGIYISDLAFSDSNGKQTLWVADQSGLYSFDGNRFVKAISYFGATNERVRFTHDRQGNLTVNLADAVARLDKKSNSWEIISAGELAGKQSRFFFSDREENLWLGTFTEGLWRLKRNFIESFDESKGITKNQTAAIMQDSRGNLWAAGFGLQRYENGRFVREKSIPESYLISLAEQRDGTLLLGGYDVFFARRADGSVTDLTGEIKSIVGNVPFAIKSIYEDSAGNLWLGFRDKGLLRRAMNGSYQRFTTANGLVGDQVQFITETKDGAVWLGVLGGTSRYLNGRFENYTTANGFNNNNIRAITETADGNLYFGTYGGGLSRLKSGVLRTVTKQNGLFDDVVSRIIVDDRDNFWMLGNQGVFYTGKRDLDAFFDGKSQQIFCRSFGTADGMISAEGNGGSQPAGWLDRDHRFWFPTIRGYVAITPPEPENYLPPAVIEEVKINNQPVDPGEGVRFDSDDQNLEIRYTGLSFTRSEQLRFRFKMDGLDSGWTDAGTRRTAYYAHPPAGEYVFIVQAANADGVWNEQSATLRLKVVPPFYQTWWFYLLVIALAAGLGCLIFAIRVARLNRAKVAQEALSRRFIQLQEEERKRIAGDLHDSLSQNLVIIKNRAMLSLAERENLESVFEQIEEIAEAAGDSLAEVREIAANLRPFQIDRLGLTKAIEALVRKSNTPKLKVAAQTEKIDGLLKPEMEINLYRIIQESLNNVIKHSGATEAFLSIKHEGKTIRIAIHDNGTGFDFGDLHRTAPPNGSGFGLMGMYERARILGAVPQIETRPGSGTKIRLDIGL